MSTQPTGSDQPTSQVVTVPVAMQKEIPSFLEDEIQLKKLQKELNKLSKDALDILSACLLSKDEKTRMSAAIKLLELQVSVAKDISTDQMQRMIAQIKLGSPGGSKAVALQNDDGERDKNKPIVDFTTIRTI